MRYDSELISSLYSKYGSPLYIFCEDEFIDNYHKLDNSFKRIYKKYQIAYSLKTNYAPYIVKLVRELGGYAEVVSGMEYYIAKRIGFEDSNIIFNGPNKGNEGVEAFLNGAMIQIDNLDEARTLCEVASSFPHRRFEVALRVNANVGQSFISRFGIDPNELGDVVKIIEQCNNMTIVGLHCHISRCRGIKEWKLRADTMLSIADELFEQPPKYIDLGSGMFGSMVPEFEAQFDNVPSYEDYAEAVAGTFEEHYKSYSYDERPLLITEPGTTLINKYIDFVGCVDLIKQVRGKQYAVLNCSVHNLGEVCTLKELPISIIHNNGIAKTGIFDFSGYTCLEQDIMRKDIECDIAQGDYVVFGNVGGYSNVLKPPFIWPNCAMLAINNKGETSIVKKSETFDDILHTYEF